MKIGTKSILFGAHMWCIHPWFVALAWWKLYGFPKDIRLWVAFFVHDLGYWGKPNMDGPEGEEHVWLGAIIMHRLFDKWEKVSFFTYEDADYLLSHSLGWELHPREDKNSVPHMVWLGKRSTKWHDFCLYHSRFYAKKHNEPFSQLCVADKLAIAFEPWWLYLPRVILSGEIKEYMELAETRTAAGEPKYASMKLATNSKRRWFNDVQEYIRRWVEEHKDMRPDTWTPGQ